MRLGTGSSPIRLSADCHTPTLKGGGSGREPFTAPMGLPRECGSQQLALALELDEMSSQRAAAWAEKKARTEALRRELAEARRLGKQRRHERRLQRMKGQTGEPATDQGRAPGVGAPARNRSTRTA